MEANVIFSASGKMNRVIVNNEENHLILEIDNHSWVSILVIGEDLEEEILREESKSRILGFVLSPGEYIVKTDGDIKKAYLESVDTGFSEPSSSIKKRTESLVLNSDAPDQHIVDGIGEVPADGTSFCTITISKLAFGGTTLTGDEHQDEVFIRTTGGMIMDAAGENHIRSLHLQSGQAAFCLVSEAQPKIVTVTVFGREPNLTKADIQIEFV